MAWRAVALNPRHKFDYGAQERGATTEEPPGRPDGSQGHNLGTGLHYMVVIKLFRGWPAALRGLIARLYPKSDFDQHV